MTAAIQCTYYVVEMYNITAESPYNKKVVPNIFLGNINLYYVQHQNPS